ncbi:MAG: LEA type 2 family protein [Bacteroidales bacterium]|nr:LEA type 2 family protein [Bacteroidales bacterium]
MAIRNFILGITICIACASCNFNNAKNIKDCTFAVESISKLMLDNVSMDGKRGLNDLSPNDFAKLTRGLMGEMPISFTAHVAISNPNNQKAELSALEWILLIKDLEVANGELDKKVKIAPNQSVTVPINVETNTKILKKLSLSEIKSIIFAISSTKGLPPNSTLKVKPAFKIGGATIKAPMYYTIDVSNQ